MLHYAHLKSIVYPLDHSHPPEFQENVASSIAWNEVAKGLWISTSSKLHLLSQYSKSEYYYLSKHVGNEKLIALQHDVMVQDAVFWQR